MGAGLPAEAKRIVHLGLGAFFRAHGLPWIAEAGDAWRVIGVSLRSAAVRDRLRPQGFHYHAVELGPDGMRPQKITALEGVLVGPEDMDRILDAIADPATHMVTLTVTEKGYCLDPATGRLDLTHPDIAHDLTAARPRSAPGVLLRGLERRRATGAGPITVLSCDNLSKNGRTMEAALRAIARAARTDLADWIAECVTFPSSMVDRIVPASTAADIDALARMGIHDAAPVLHEHFRQWVIEDNFAAARPPLETVGVDFTCDIAPYEEMKLRMLNGAHSALAYLGQVMGHEWISDAARDPDLDALLKGMWQREIIPTLTAPDGIDLTAYAAQLRDRFRNPAIRYGTAQVASDGSQKLPQRILPPLAENIATGRDCDGMLLLLAAWFRHLSGLGDDGLPQTVSDPLAAYFKKIHATAPTPEDAATRCLACRDVFDADLAGAIAPRLVPLYAKIAHDGARSVLREIVR